MAPGSLQALVAYLDTHPDVGIAGSYVHGIDGDPHTAAFTFPSLWSEVEGTVRLGPVTRLLARHRVPRPIPAESTDDVDWVTGASMLIRRDVLDKIGLFDETFFLYFEETDLCRRAHNAGFKVAFVREASVAHIQGATTGVTNLKRRTPGYVLDSRRWYFLKHHGRPYLWAANVAHGVGMLSFRIRRRLQNKPDPDFESALADLSLIHI